MDRVAADLRAHEARQDRLEEEWECLDTAQKLKRVIGHQEPVLRDVMRAYLDTCQTEDWCELGRRVSLLLNDWVDEL